MELKNLKEELLNNKIRPLYIFTGIELALQDVYINKIKEISKLNSIRTEYLKNVYNKFNSRSLIKLKPNIYIIRDDEDYLKSEKTWENFKKNKLNGNIVILLYTNIEKSSKFYKAHEDIIVNFDYIDRSLLKNRLMVTTGMNEQSCKELVDICNGNYGVIQHEVYNLMLLSEAIGCSLQTSYLESRRNNTITEYIGDIIFDFTNSVIDRDIYKAYSLYEKIKQTDEGAVKLLSVLYNSFRNVLIVQSTNNNERTEEILGLTKAQIYVTSQKCNKYNLFELVNAIKTIRYLEKGIKTGEVDSEFCIDYLFSQIF